MGKLVPLLFAGAGTATASVGGFYLVKGSAQSTEGDGPSAPTRIETNSLIFDSVDAFKANWKTNSKCVKDYFVDGFGTDEEPTSVKDLSSANVPDTNTFFKVVNDAQNPYRSCLTINWKKENFRDNKWKGKFTWVWTFVKGDEGFVNFNVAETVPAEKKLEFKGILYLLEKTSNSGNNRWEVKYKKDSKTDVKAGETELDQYFPKKGININSDKGDYWGFIMDESNKLNNMCGSEECASQEGVTPKFEVVELYWEGSKTNSAGTNKLKDWSADLVWWSKIYEDSSWNLGTKVENFAGTWSKKTEAIKPAT